MSNRERWKLIKEEAESRKKIRRALKTQPALPGAEDWLEETGSQAKPEIRGQLIQTSKNGSIELFE